jgi:hypothetical protein
MPLSNPKRSWASTLLAPAGQSTRMAAACRRILSVRCGFVTFGFKGPASKTVDWVLAAVSTPGCADVVARGRQVHQKGRCTPRSAFRGDVGFQVKTPSERFDRVDARCRPHTKQRRRRSGVDGRYTDVADSRRRQCCWRCSRGGEKCNGLSEPRPNRGK